MLDTMSCAQPKKSRADRSVAVAIKMGATKKDFDDTVAIRKSGYLAPKSRTKEADIFRPYFVRGARYSALDTVDDRWCLSRCKL
jgi:hypothetical protein